MVSGLPQFIGVGVQKGGTTSLHTILSQHPDIYLPQRKELQYFSLNYAKGIEWYRDQFKCKKEDQLCGEISPYYIFHPCAILRISEVMPDVKIIILLRDPVDRALSQYFHSRRLGLENLPLQKALCMEIERLSGADERLLDDHEFHKSHQEHSYLSRSKYSLQLQQVFEYFSKEQVFLRKSEDLFENPTLLCDELFDFLNVKKSQKIHFKKNMHQGCYSYTSDHEILIAKKQLEFNLRDTYKYMKDVYGITWS